MERSIFELSKSFQNRENGYKNIDDDDNDEGKEEDILL